MLAGPESLRKTCDTNIVISALAYRVLIMLAERNIADALRWNALKTV